MEITSAQYVVMFGVNDSIKATIDGVEMTVPLDPANTDYSALLEWAAKDGNTIET